MKKTVLFILSLSILFGAAVCVGAAIKINTSGSLAGEVPPNTSSSHSSVTAPADETETVDENAAKQTALDNAGLMADTVTFTKLKLDKDDGRAIYDIEFYTDSAQYDYEIDAATGTILDYDYDNLTYSYNAQTDSASQYIGEDTAKEAALAHAGLSEEDTTYMKAKLDRDDRTVTYDIEFYSGSMEYDYEIDALTGTVVSYSHDHAGSAGLQNTGESGIDLEKAKSAAFTAAGFSETQVTVREAKLDHDDGVTVYKIEFIANSTEYEVEIDAVTGAVIDFDTESLYD